MTDRRRSHVLTLQVRDGAKIERVATSAYFVLANFNVRRLSFLMDGKLVTCEPKDSVEDIQKRYEASFAGRYGGGK